MTKRNAISLLAIATLASCMSCGHTPHTNPKVNNIDTGYATLPDTIPLDQCYKVEGDSIVITPFTIDIELTPKAKDRIISGKETMIIEVSITGDLKDTTQTDLLADDGNFYLANPSREVQLGQTAIFQNVKISKKMFDQVADKNLFVLAFLYSGRRSTDLNLLEGDVLTGQINEIAGQKLIMKAKLIGNDD